MYTQLYLLEASIFSCDLWAGETAHIFKQLTVKQSLTVPRGQKFGSTVSVSGGSHLLGVIVEHSDGAQLGSNAAGLREGCAALLVWPLFEFISNGDISDRRWPRLHVHLRQESRVQQEAPDGDNQTHQEEEQQQQQNQIRHGFSQPSNWGCFFFNLQKLWQS